MQEEKRKTEEGGRKTPEAQAKADTLTPAELASMERVSLSGTRKKVTHSSTYTMEPCEMLGRQYANVSSR